MTSLEMLEALIIELHDARVDLYLARVAGPVRDLFDRSGFVERLGPDRIFTGISVATAAFLRAMQDPVSIHDA